MVNSEMKVLHKKDQKYFEKIEVQDLFNVPETMPP